jgi:hypothetical protein
MATKLVKESLKAYTKDMNKDLTKNLDNSSGQLSKKFRQIAASLQLLRKPEQSDNMNGLTKNGLK